MRFRHFLFAGLSLIALMLPASLKGAVVESANSRFTISISFRVDSTPERIYEALTAEVGRWWSSDHTFSGDAANLTIDPQPGGCFCERFPGGGGARHGIVVFAGPGQSLRVESSLGPLQALPVQGVLEWRMEPEDGDVEVTLTYRVAGQVNGGLESWADPVDRVLTQQMDRFRSYLVTGRAP